MTQALWLVAVFGLTWIITRSVLFAPLRALFPKPMGSAPFLGTLLRCPQCMGFWVGAFFSLAGFNAFELLIPAHDRPSFPAWLAAHLHRAAVEGLIASGFGYFMKLVCEKLGEGPLDE